MKFTYYYRKGDGVRREGEIESPSRDEAFAALREVGIRPIKMYAKDGTKENGAPMGGRKRALTIVTLSALLILALGYIVVRDVINMSNNVPGSETSMVKSKIRPVNKNDVIESEVIGVTVGGSLAKPRPRRQLPHATTGEFDRLSVFKHPSDRLLALFAEPGKDVVVPMLTDDVRGDFIDALDDDICIEPGDAPGVVEIKRVVAGMKEEAALILKSGKSADELLQWLVARQEMERGFREKIMNAVESGEETRDAANAKLRAMGMKEL